MTNIDIILISGIALLLGVVALRIWIGRRRQTEGVSNAAIKSPRTVSILSETKKAVVPPPANLPDVPPPAPSSDSVTTQTSPSSAKKNVTKSVEKNIEIDDPLTLIKTFSAPVEKRINAIREAGIKKMIAAVPALIEALYEPDQAISLAATESLGAIGDPRAIEPLLEISRRSDAVLMREVDGGEEAGQMGHGEHEKVVEDSADSNPYKFKEMVIFKIDQLPLEYFQQDGTPIPRKELVVKGLKDNSQQMRQMAAKAAIGLDSEEIVEPLIEALTNPFEVESVRFMAAEALGGMQNDKSIESLLGALQDENVAVRYSAAAALSGRKNKQIVSALINAMNDSDKFVRSSVAYALGTTGDHAALQALVRCAADESEVVRFSVAKAIACFQVDEVLKELNSLRDSTGSAGILVMIEVLGHIKDERSVALLKKYLNSPDSEISYKASIALMGQENPDIFEELIAASKRLDEELCNLAKKNLNPRKVDKPLYNDANAGVSVEKSVKPLEAIKNLPQNLEKLRKGLLDPSPNIRGSAANTLGDFNSQEALALLAAAAKDDNEFVRASVVNSLGKIATNGALSLVLEMENDSSEEVRYAIVKALSAMPDASGRACLVRRSTSDKSKNVKRAARLALEKLETEGEPK